MTIALLLDMAREGMPDRVAVGRSTDGLTYAALRERAGRAATIAVDAGARRLVLVDVNGPLVPTLLFASSLAGVPFVPLNYRLSPERLGQMVERAGPALAVGERARVGGAGSGAVTWCEPARLEDLMAEGGAGALPAVDDDAVAVWLFTSGTTGEPKPGLLRHHHLVSYVLSTVEYMSADADEAALVSVPPYHVAGMAAVLSNVYAGRRIVYLPQFDAEAWLALARREAVTHAMVVPTMLGRLLDLIEEGGGNLPALRHLSSGGGRMPVPVIERAMAVLPHVDFVNAYGLTETSSTVSVLGPEDHRVAGASDDPRVRARLGSVGKPLASIELEIRGADGEVLPPGASGEIYVRGDQVAGEYEGRSVLDADGWFATNDGGHLDADGFLYVEGRLDDVIVRGGENIAPGEVEAVLAAHPAVSEVAVLGVPDDEWGEVVAAAVVLAAGQEATAPELQAWVRRHLRSSRMPALVQFREELPHNEMGKILRRALRAEIMVEAG